MRGLAGYTYEDAFLVGDTMAWPLNLVLVRHAESEGNVRTVEERAAFDLSTHAYPLTARGREQSEKTRDYLRERFGRFDVRYTSYYERARETMRILCPGERVYEDPRLAEASRGIWHTMTRAEIEAAYPHEIIRRDREGYYHHRPLGGESWPDVELRIHSFLGTLARDYEGQRVLIVCHGFWLILFQRLIEHFSIEEAVRRYKEEVVENASVTIYRGGRHLVPIQHNIVPWMEV